MCPFSKQPLLNLIETAPETWGESFYTENSDVFSFAIILWNLFGAKLQYEINQGESTLKY
jgi:hypothetical protein